MGLRWAAVQRRWAVTIQLVHDRGGRVKEVALPLEERVVKEQIMGPTNVKG